MIRFKFYRMCSIFAFRMTMSNISVQDGPLPQFTLNFPCCAKKKGVGNVLDTPSQTGSARDQGILAVPETSESAISQSGLRDRCTYGYGTRGLMMVCDAMWNQVVTECPAVDGRVAAVCRNVILLPACVFSMQLYALGRAWTFCTWPDKGSKVAPCSVRPSWGDGLGDGVWSSQKAVGGQCSA